MSLFFILTGSAWSNELGQDPVPSPAVPPEAPQGPPPFSEFEAQLHEVSDGDTISFKPNSDQVEMFAKVKHRLRFTFIDTPESNFQNENQGEFASDASESLRSLLANAQSISIKVYDSPLDPYKRVLGTLHLGKLELNLEQVKRGLAFPFFYFPDHRNPRGFVKTAEENFLRYLEAFQSARQQKVGMFKPSFKYDLSIPLIPHEFRSHHMSKPEAKYLGNLLTCEVLKGELAATVPLQFRVFLPWDTLSLEQASSEFSKACQTLSSTFKSRLRQL